MGCVAYTKCVLAARVLDAHQNALVAGRLRRSARQVHIDLFPILVDPEPREIAPVDIDSFAPFVKGDGVVHELKVVLDQNRTIYLNRQGQSERNKILNRYPTGINALNDAKKKEKKLYLPYL